MRQPELGKKICALRAARGLTQEELVDRCNVSVRTIQRIESGEVMPRSYTIKTIFAALDYDIKDIGETELKLSPKMRSVLQFSWIAGIIYILLGIIEGAADYFLVTDGATFMDTPFYILLKVIVLATFIVFQWGIYGIGDIYNQYLVRLVSILIIAVTAASIGLDIASLYEPSLGNEWVSVATLIIFGGVSLLYGFAIMKLQDQIGRVATLAGALYMITGICFITVLLLLFGVVLLFAADLILIVAIYKVRQIFDAGHERRGQIVGAV